jgi:hypothetical protein
MALEGTFNDMPLADLIDVFRIGLKSGILDIIGEQQHGSVYVSYGRLIDATIWDSLSERVKLAGDQAVLDLLTWRDSRFVFVPDLTVIRRPVTIFLDSGELIRQSEERNAVKVVFARADGDLRNTTEYGALDNHEFSADLGGCQRESRVPSQQVWRFRPATPDQPIDRPNPSSSLGTQAAAPALLERACGQPTPAKASTPAPAAPINAAARPASRLLQAVIRRVRSL